MDDWFSVIAAGCELPASAARELDEVGFVVVPGPVAPPQLSRLAAVYDAAVSAAAPADLIVADPEVSRREPRAFP